MNFETFVVIRNISVLSVLVPLILLVFALRKREQPVPVKLLGILLSVSALSDVLSLVLYMQFKINPNPVNSVYVWLQFILMSLIYKAAYTRIWYKRIIDIGIITFTIFAIVNMFFIQGVNGFNSNTFTVSSIAFMFYSLLHSYQLVKDLPELHIERMFMFWFSAAVFIYFGTNLFLFATIDRLIVKADNQFLLSWGFHNGTNAFKNLLFAIALYVTTLSRKSILN
ncbi:hypothetical protein [Ohtaekwangia koreensis]|uniref:YhhN-like protein n=1 Tax=Ohtaekwangia koreensis TaxID=688867 RepID=A0A1T5M739_9BACT|nr:hypothetical protein [Ohtaekwangia koreensis]SKC83923.1 hypothetical protein SAMN05660236_4592 [Ohtaekwangia koreensis]